MLIRLATLAAIAIAFVACSTPVFFVPEQTLLRPVVDRLGESSIRIRWPESFSSDALVVYRGIDPSFINRSVPLAVVVGEQSVILTHEDDPDIRGGRRLYFELVPASGGRAVITTERRLPLACCDNFRDLGGYETTDGRVVRWDRLYRTGELSKLTRSDLKYLSQFDVKLVCDFRSNRERVASPDRTIDDAPEMLDLPVDQEGVDPERLRTKIRTGGLVALGVEQTMLDAYRAFVTDYSQEWTAMFQRLVREENLPTVVHCTAGKDRTGFASALVLLALGVPEETVFEDYLSTNYYQQNFFRFVFRWIPLYSFFRTDPEDLLPLIEARREYLQTSLDEMVASYGSIDAYLERALGLDAEMRAKLEHHFLE
jgi:protein-tyrosine phosphatase